MRAAALAALAAPAPAPASCPRTATDQDRVAQAFVSAALRLAPPLGHSDPCCRLHALHVSPFRVFPLRVLPVRP